MAIPIEGRFEVDAPVEQVWAYFQNPRRVALCLPGAELTKVVNENTYQGRVRLRVGPVAAQYSGTIIIESMDRQSWTAQMLARGDQQGAPGRAEARLTFSLLPKGNARTEIVARAEVSIAGRLARVGGALIQTASKQLFHKFADCVQRDILASYDAPTP